MAEKNKLVHLNMNEQDFKQAKFESAVPTFDGHETMSLFERFVMLSGVIKSYLFRGDSIGLLGDVDLTTTAPSSGDQLEFDGTNWVPKTLDNGYTIFPIWAEESTDLAAGAATEWSFGNGDDTPAVQGIPIPFDCELFAMSATVEGGNAIIRTLVNGANPGAAYQISVTSPSATSIFGTPLAVTSGQVLNFQTVSSSGANTNSGRVCAWFRVKASAASTALITELLDVDTTGVNTDDILRWDGTNWVPQALPAATPWPAIQTFNTNTTTDLEVSTSTAFVTNIPIVGTVQNFDDPGSDFTTSGNTVVCNFSGTVTIDANVHIISNAQRSAMQMRVKVNGTAQGPIGSSGYIRNASGHAESSLHISGYVIQVSPGDTIGLGSRIEAANGNTRMQQAGSSMLKVERRS